MHYCTEVGYVQLNNVLYLNFILSLLKIRKGDGGRERGVKREEGGGNYLFSFLAL